MLEAMTASSRPLCLRIEIGVSFNAHPVVRMGMKSQDARLESITMLCQAFRVLRQKFIASSSYYTRKVRNLSAGSASFSFFTTGTTISIQLSAYPDPWLEISCICRCVSIDILKMAMDRHESNDTCMPRTVAVMLSTDSRQTNIRTKRMGLRP